MRHAVTTLFLLCLISMANSQDLPDRAPIFPAVPHHEEMVGQFVPDVTFTGQQDDEIALSAYRGRPVLIDLWATWCAPCRAALPSIGRIYAEFKDKGLEVISFDQEEVQGDDRDAAAAARYLAQHRYEWKNFHDTDRKVATALQCDGLPLAVLIDASGKIAYFDFGNRKTEAELRKAIEDLVPRKPPAAPSNIARPDESRDTAKADLKPRTKLAQFSVAEGR